VEPGASRVDAQLTFAPGADASAPGIIRRKKVGKAIIDGIERNLFFVRYQARARRAARD
jgi:hypothetical protein